MTKVVNKWHEVSLLTVSPNSRGWPCFPREFQRGDPGLAMRSTKAVDKLPQAMLGGRTKNADKLHQQARLRYAHITLSCFPSPEHVAQDCASSRA